MSNSTLLLHHRESSEAMFFMRSFFSSSAAFCFSFSILRKSIHSVRSKGQLISESLILASPVSLVFELVSRVFLKGFAPLWSCAVRSEFWGAQKPAKREEIELKANGNASQWGVWELVPRLWTPFPWVCCRPDYQFIISNKPQIERLSKFSNFEIFDFSNICWFSPTQLGWKNFQTKILSTKN